MSIGDYLNGQVPQGDGSNGSGPPPQTKGSGLLGAIGGIPVVGGIVNSLDGENARTAANGAAAGQWKSGQEARQIGTQQQSAATAMTGQAQANYYQPQQYWNNLYGPGGSMSQPGYGEQAYRDYGQGFLQPSNTQGWYDQQHGALSSPSASESFYNRQNYGAPTASQNLYGQLTAQGSFNRDAMGDAYGGLNYQMSQPGQLANNFGALNRQFTQGDTLEAYQGMLTGQYQGSNVLDQNLGGLQARGQGYLASRNNQAIGLLGQEQSPSTTQGEYGNIRNLITGSNQGQRMYGAQLGQLAGPGMYEQFVQGALTGNDPYYARLSEEGSNALDASMNARGGYNSGAAMKAQGNFQSGLRADQYHQLADMAQGAQGAQMSRLGQGMTAALGVGGESRARAAGMQGLAGQTEGELQQRLQAQNLIGQQGYENASGLNRQLGDWYGKAGEERLGIAKGLQGMASDIDTQRFNRTQGAANLAQATDQQSLAQLRARGDLANMTATQRLNYLTQQGAQARAGDDTYRMMLAEGSGAAHTSSADQLARMGMGFTGGNLADINHRAGLSDYLTGASGAQGLAQGRMTGGFGGAMDIAGARSGLTMQGGQYGMGEYDKWLEAALGLQGNANQLNMQGAQDQTRTLLALTQGGINAYNGGNKTQPNSGGMSYW